MKLRVKFSKLGYLKFIGHLDVQRYFQKALRRAGLDVAYTEGYNPHQIMSFAQPLGIGQTSTSEYMDVEMRSPISSAEFMERVNAIACEGILITKVIQVPEGKASKAMTLTAAADYFVNFRRGHEPGIDWQEGLTDFFAQPEITVLKKTKRSEKEVDIRPLIYDWRVQDDGVFLKLSAGSVANLKPELVLTTYFAGRGITLDDFALAIHRAELYANMGTEEEPRLVALGDLGEEVP